MSVHKPISMVDASALRAQHHEWLGLVLTRFAQAEQSLGRLCIALELPVQNGPLTSLEQLQAMLARMDHPRCKALNNRIVRWKSLCPTRHLLAHATLHILTDEADRTIVITRHLPRDRNDVTPDRMWLPDEMAELLRQVTSDGRSVTDQVSNILSDKRLLVQLKRV